MSNGQENEVGTLRRELRSAYAELNRVGERLENQTRFTEVIERKLRELFKRDNSGSESVEVMDSIPPLNGGAALTSEATNGRPGPYRSIDPHMPVQTDNAWWPRNTPTPRPLIPNAGWWNYSLQGRTEKVIGISVCGLDREALERIIGIVAEQQTARRDFVPLFLTDSTDFDLFRKHGFVFEHLPAPAKRAQCCGAQEWDEYAAERRALLERKWGLAQVICFGPAEFGKPLPAHSEAQEMLVRGADPGLCQDDEQAPLAAAVRQEGAEPPSANGVPVSMCRVDQAAPEAGRSSPEPNGKSHADPDLDQNELARPRPRTGKKRKRTAPVQSAASTAHQSLATAEMDSDPGVGQVKVANSKSRSLKPANRAARSKAALAPGAQPDPEPEAPGHDPNGASPEASVSERAKNASRGELTLRHLAARDERLARAITANRDPHMPVLAEIERRRSGLLTDNRPLVDGTLGPPGIYDGDRTIAAACSVSKSPRGAHLLHALSRTFEPGTVIELGTNVGISSAYIAAGLGQGKLTTLEASPYRLRLAQELHRSLGLRNVDYIHGLFADTLVPALDAMPPIEMAFIDGHHQYRPTLDYFDVIWRHSAENCIFIFDDIRWSSEMKRAWRELRRDSRVSIAADLWSVGICITTRGEVVAPYRTPPIKSVLA